MVTELGNDLKLEMDVPFVQVQRLVFTWKASLLVIRIRPGDRRISFP